MELLFSIKNGSFPLYSPGYAMGQSSIALTWSQIFHPIAFLAYIMPGYWSGKALHWHTFYKILSLGLTQLALFVVLRALRLNTILSFLLSFITVYNLRMLDLIRFGPSLEAFTAHLLLCAAASWLFLYPSRILGFFGIIASTYLVVVSGHPQMMYYGLLGSVLFILIAPYILGEILGDRQADLKSVSVFWGKAALCIALGIALSSLYVVPFYFDFYASNTVRVGASYEWSIGTQSFFGVLSNFFVPYLSDVHGAFGGSSIIILTFLFPVLRLFKVKIPTAVWATWGIVLIILLFMLGPRTPVHRFAWEYLPFMSAFRNQGRISLIMPIFLMVILAWTGKNALHAIKIRLWDLELSPYSVLAFIGALLIPLYVLVFFAAKPALGFLPPIKINDIPTWILFIILLSGIASLISLCVYGVSIRASRAVGILLCILTVIQVTVLLRFGTFIVPVKDRLTLEEIESQKRESLDYRYHDLPGMQASVVMEQIENSFIDPYLGRIFTQVESVQNSQEAYNIMRQSLLPQQIFIEGFDPIKAAELTRYAQSMTKGSVEVIYSSFNRLTFRVSSEAPAVFGFSYPNTGHWNASVNGKRVPVYKANGAAHAVEIPAGESTVDFRYWSSAYFWGMLISSVSFLAIGAFFCFRILGGAARIAAIFIIILIGAGGFIAWYNSLYTGNNLETRYTWTYSPPGDSPNIAYGKKTTGYELPSTSYLNRHRSTAVDGNTSPGSGFSLSRPDEKLIVDLSRIEEIKQIVLYGWTDSLPVLSTSEDGKNWYVHSPDMYTVSEGRAFRLRFGSPRAARYVRVQASATALNINEVEVY